MDFRKVQGPVWVISVTECVDPIGRRFAEVEYLTFLIIVVQKWRVNLREAWTEQQARDALDRNVMLLTVQPAVSIPLVFRRRE